MNDYRTKKKQMRLDVYEERQHSETNSKISAAKRISPEKNLKTWYEKKKNKQPKYINQENYFKKNEVLS